MLLTKSVSGPTGLILRGQFEVVAAPMFDAICALP
jgi:hypothetical protein